MQEVVHGRPVVQIERVDRILLDLRGIGADDPLRLG